MVFITKSSLPLLAMLLMSLKNKGTSSFSSKLWFRNNKMHLSLPSRMQQQEHGSLSPWSNHNTQDDLNGAHEYLCIITETSACDSDERMEATCETLEKALGGYNENGVDLISVRVATPTNSKDKDQQESFNQRLLRLCSRIMALKERQQKHIHYNDYKVVINDMVHLDTAVQANVDGIHVKEKDVAQIPRIRKELEEARSGGGTGTLQNVIIGTSCHSIESGVCNWVLYNPDYMFVGTCYMTQSHPEKNADDLEGPMLPGSVKQNILDMAKDNKGARLHHRCPIIFAIGGIEESNCSEPVSYGADGVAVIRSIMQASDPFVAVRRMKLGMKAQLHVD